MLYLWSTLAANSGSPRLSLVNLLPRLGQPTDQLGPWRASCAQNGASEIACSMSAIPCGHVGMRVRPPCRRACAHVGRCWGERARAELCRCARRSLGSGRAVRDPAAHRRIVAPPRTRRAGPQRRARVRSRSFQPCGGVRRARTRGRAHARTGECGGVGSGSRGGARARGRARLEGRGPVVRRSVARGPQGAQACRGGRRLVGSGGRGGGTLAAVGQAVGGVSGKEVGGAVGEAAGTAASGRAKRRAQRLAERRPHRRAERLSGPSWRQVTTKRCAPRPTGCGRQGAPAARCGDAPRPAAGDAPAAPAAGACGCSCGAFRVGALARRGPNLVIVGEGRVARIWVELRYTSFDVASKFIDSGKTCPKARKLWAAIGATACA